MAPLPAIDILQDAARRLVHAAKRSNELDTLTPRLVREQLVAKYELEDDALEGPVMKESLKMAITTAAAEDTEPESDNEASSSKKKLPAKTAAPKKRKTAASAADVKPSKKHASSKRAPDRHSSDESAVEISSSDRRQSTPLTSRTSMSAEAEDKSDSEMSVLIDATPVKKKKKGVSAKAERKPSGKNKRAKKEESEPADDDERIKRLKSYVVGCGVRKQWKKELDPLSKPEQIRKLKKMLADLGMRGKLSLEKAKQIRAQRELTEEIAAAEEFNRKINRTGARRGAVVDAKKTRAELDTTSEEESSEEESDDEVKVKARGKNAAQSINAFLDELDSD